MIRGALGGVRQIHPVLAAADGAVVLFFDTFTGSGLLTAHPPDIDRAGTGWIIVTGDFDIISNQAVTLIGNQSIRANMSKADRTLTVRIYSNAAINALGQTIVFVKITDAANWLRVQIAGGLVASTIELRERVGASINTRASTTISNTDPDWFDFTIVTSGTSITVDVVSSEGMTASMTYGSAILSSETYAGMQAATTNAGFDNFRAVP